MHFYECYEEGGFLSINFSCANKNVKKAIESVINILQTLTKSKISKEELVLTRKKAGKADEIDSEENCRMKKLNLWRTNIGTGIKKLR